MKTGHSLTVMVAVFLAFAVLAPSLLAEPGQYYRYRNEKGVVVIDDKIPPELAPNGYDVITREGILVRRVERELSDEELRLRNTEESRARLREEEARRMQAWDESLLLKYSDLADLEAARERAIRDLQIRISILKSNRSSLKSQIEREQQRAADIERRGLDVPADVSDAIDQMRIEIEDIEASIDARAQEVDEVRAAFQRDIDRFKTLQDRIELRRQISSPSSSGQSY